MNIVLDIETIPTGERDLPVFPRKPLKEDVKLGNTKDPEKVKALRDQKYPELIEQWNNDCAEEALKADHRFRRRALTPHLCQVVCVAIKTDTEERVFISGDEKDVMITLQGWVKDLTRSLYDVTWIGVNIRNFDLVILRQRAWKYRLNNLSLCLERGKVIDIMDKFTGSRYKDYLVSKNDMCAFFGVKVDDDGDGSMVYDQWVDGEHEKISGHCLADVQKEYELYEIMGQ